MAREDHRRSAAAGADEARRDIIGGTFILRLQR
jgi:hypothetical protein